MDVRPHHFTGAGREDWWSETATKALIHAWGDRYLKLNRGNLRQTDWEQVADAVNSANPNPRLKTDVQCKNRIDTLKKKYKLEKAKQVPSKWMFFQRLDSLIGVPKKTLTGVTTGNSARIVLEGLKSTATSSDEEEEEDEDEWELVPSKQPQVEREQSDVFDGCRELAGAILRFGEIYERIEVTKQQQLMDLEKQRMEFSKDLELQRMKMMIDTRLKLQKLKRKKYD